MNKTYNPTEHGYAYGTPSSWAAQDVFDFVVHHLRKQRRRAVFVHADYDACAYRTSEGCACAVGCLIPDDLLTRDNGTLVMWNEGMSVRSLLDPRYSILDILDDTDLYPPEDSALLLKVREYIPQNLTMLLTDLQCAHDQLELWQDDGIHESALGDIAMKYGLTLAPAA